ncbi:DUF882 domain-containing protein [Parvibaculum sp. MBR-TMA-1.3b-4.2]|jgi:uncharacterized protein YcbK (DUF882 family)
MGEKKPGAKLLLPNRRDTLRGLGTLGLGTALTFAAPSIVRADAPYKKRLKLQSLNSGEKLDMVYWADGKYLPHALKRMRHFMRDLRTETTHEIHPGLLDLMWEIDQNTRSKNPIYTMSGYRSPQTNEWLLKHSDGIDPGSFHMRGMAVDITQNFLDPEEVYRVALKLKKGGAGYYPTKRPFVHVDIGPRDNWVYPAMPTPGRDKEYDRQQAEKAKARKS